MSKTKKVKEVEKTVYKHKFQYRYVGISNAVLPSIGISVRPNQVVDTDIEIDNPLYKAIK